GRSSHAASPCPYTTLFRSDRERLHGVPAGEVGAADVADFAGADEAVEGVEGFLDGGEGVLSVHEVDVDVVGAETAEAVVEDGGRSEEHTSELHHVKDSYAV